MIDVWTKIKQSKGFYIRTYKKTLTFTLVSLGLNIVLILAIIYAYIHTPKRHFYATSGATPLIEMTQFELQPLNAPNASSEALLPPDPPDVNNEYREVPTV